MNVRPSGDGSGTPCARASCRSQYASTSIPRIGRGQSPYPYRIRCKSSLLLPSVSANIWQLGYAWLNAHPCTINVVQRMSPPSQPPSSGEPASPSVPIVATSVTPEGAPSTARSGAQPKGLFGEPVPVLAADLLRIVEERVRATRTQSFDISVGEILSIYERDDHTATP